MRIGSLFSGAGALDLAALELFPGSSMAWHAEVNPAASKVLAHHWPDVPNLGDVSAVDWSTVESVDVLTGGFPCQDVSLAGRRAGLAEGTRSGLWSFMFAAIRVMRPRLVLIENVRGLLSARAIRDMESGNGIVGAGGDGSLRALGAVLGDLSSIGFDADWTLIRASDVGACHQRARVFVLAYPADSDRDAVRQQPECESWRRGASVAGVVGEDAADSDHPGLQGPQSAKRHDLSAGRDRELGCGMTSLLPTPQVADVTGGHRPRSGARSNELLLPGLVEAAAAGALLPTPRASDGTKGGPNQRGSSGDLMLPSAVTQWGDYEAAIRRQEAVTRAAPSPTQPNVKGAQRLSAAFAEWMMCWPDGWVTDPAIGLSRNEQLKCIGNGVVPRQAVHAFQHLLNVSEAAA